ncbi:MAG: hypothetical protein ABI855_10770, partial [Bacteroidota bacterium]
MAEGFTDAFIYLLTMVAVRIKFFIILFIVAQKQKKALPDFHREGLFKYYFLPDLIQPPLSSSSCHLLILLPA